MPSRSQPFRFVVKVLAVLVAILPTHHRSMDAIPYSTSVQELVEHFEKHSLARHFPGMETTLALPFRVAMARKGGSFVAISGLPF